jgi:hypothetical protein
MVIAFEPVNSGTEALQAVAPVAVPEPPKLFAQMTVVTPILSLTVPLIVIEDSAVETVVEEGEAMVSEGGVVSVGLVAVVGVVD